MPINNIPAIIINITFILVFNLLLCLNSNIPIIAPRDPPIKLKKNNENSDILLNFFMANSLSKSYISIVIILIIIK